MSDPNHFDADKTATIGGFLLTCILTLWGSFIGLFKTFTTRAYADSTFVKKVEADGTRSYVHPKEWQEMKERMDKSIEQGDRWQKIARDWMDNP